MQIQMKDEKSDFTLASPHWNAKSVQKCVSPFQSYVVLFITVPYIILVLSQKQQIILSSEAKPNRHINFMLLF